MPPVAMHDGPGFENFEPAALAIITERAHDPVAVLEQA